jgi:cellulose biosynthesis protein BcsQ
MITFHIMLFQSQEAIPAFRDATKALRADVQPVTGPSHLAVLSRTWGATDRAILLMDARTTTSDVFHEVLRQRSAIPCEVQLVFFGNASTPFVLEAKQTNVATVIPDNDIATVVHEVTKRFGIPAIEKQTIAVAVGSAKGGVGKSLLIGRFAEALAMMGVRVLLVDMDVSNPSLVTDLRISSGHIIPFLSQRRAVHGHKLTMEVLRQTVYTVHVHHGHPWTFDLLTASQRQSTTTKMQPMDLTWAEWTDLYGMLLTMRTTDGDPYDIVLIDTGPDVNRRPYAIYVVSSGGYLVIPTTGRPQDIDGMMTMLTMERDIQQGTPDLQPFARTFIVPSHSARGSIHQPGQVITSVRTLLDESWVKDHVLPPIPRDDYLISVCETMQRYVSPLLIGRGTRFTEQVFRNTQRLAEAMGIALRVPPPSIPWYTRLLRHVSKQFGIDRSYLETPNGERASIAKVSSS